MVISSQVRSILKTFLSVSVEQKQDMDEVYILKTNTVSYLAYFLEKLNFYLQNYKIVDFSICI